MIVLGIESSCDDTCLAVVQNGQKVLYERSYSQALAHQKFGGIVPEVAAREHLVYVEILLLDLLSNLKKKELSLKEISRIAVTNGPGLISSLLVGVTLAKTLSWVLKKEIVSVDHLNAHLCANFLETVGSGTNQNKPKNKEEFFPLVCLLASGGHTQLLYLKSFQEIKLLGETLDDSCGEAFDKVARMLDLNYPGGPEIEKLASLSEKPSKYQSRLPKVIKLKNEFSFSFSGIKTAMLYLIQELTSKQENYQKADLAAAFQELVCRELANKLIKACKKYSCRKIAIAGGVSANQRLRAVIEETSKKHLDYQIKFFKPEKKYCTDNASMVASAGYFIPDHFGLDFGVYSVPSAKINF